MGRLGCFTIFVVIVVLFALATSPGKESHVKKVASVVSAVIEDDNSSDDGIDIVTIDKANGINLVERSLDRMITVEDYLLCSVGKVKWRNREHIVSFGIFGIVVTAPKEMLKTKAKSLLSI